MLGGSSDGGAEGDDACHCTPPTSGSGTGTSQGSGIGTSAPPNVLSKVDLLFDIDNSASMGDKQQYLLEAVPEMVARLVTPRCLDASGNPTGANANPTCSMGTPEFKRWVTCILES